MLLSAGMLSVFTLFAKFATKDTPYLLLSFLRFTIPFVLLLPFLLWKTSLKTLFSTKHLKLQFLRTGCILVSQYTIFYYLQRASLLDTTVLQNTSPLFLPILEKLFFRYRFDWRVILSILISFVGVLCILQPDSGFFDRFSFIGFLAPLGQAGSQVLYRHQARNENRESTLFYLFLLTSIASTIIYFFSSEFHSDTGVLKNYSTLAWVNIFLMGIASIFNQSFRGVAYAHGTPSALSPFLYFSIIVSGILDWAIFHVLPNKLSLAGAFLVLLGGLIQLWKWKRRTS